MKRNLDEIKKYYSEINDDVLQNIASTEIEELDDEVKEVVHVEMEKRSLNKTEEPAEIKLNETKLNEYMEDLKLEQNFPKGIVGGVIAGLIGAIAWAAITVTTGYQIGYMAIAIGLFVGFSVRFFGKGLDNVYGIVGAIIALLSCVLGNLLSIVGYAANAEGLGCFEALTMVDFSLIPTLLMDTFSPMDLLFYGFAVYQGYKFSFRQITEEEIIEHATDK